MFAAPSWTTIDLYPLSYQRQQLINGRRVGYRGFRKKMTASAQGRYWPQQKISDGAAFLWRSELAGHPRDAAAWRALYEYASSALPRPGNGLADLHVTLTQAVMGDDARARQIDELARDGHYPSGFYRRAW